MTESLLPNKSERRSKEDRPSSPPSQKTESAESKMNLDTTGPSNATPHGLPPLLSPVDQPLSNPYGLPAILSPTLPSNVQAELDKLEIKRNRAESDASNSSSSQITSLPDSRPPKRDESSTTNSRVRSASINGKSPNRILPHQMDPTSPTLLVKLKYGKKMGATVTQLLRLPPSRKTTTITEKRERQEDGKEQRPVKAQAKGIDGVAVKSDGALTKSKDTTKIISRRPESAIPNKAGAIGAKVAEKRPRSEDDNSLVVSAKRQRRQTLEGPRTPSQQIITSPTRSSKSSTQKSQGPFTTPRKDHKAISMLRTNSTEGNDSTPGRSGATPAASRHLDPKAPLPPIPLNAKKQVDIQSLSQISMRLNQMGRSLKHEAQKVIIEKGNKASKEELKRAAVTSLECVL